MPLSQQDTLEDYPNPQPLQTGLMVSMPLSQQDTLEDKERFSAKAFIIINVSMPLSQQDTLEAKSGNDYKVYITMSQCRSRSKILLKNQYL